MQRWLMVLILSGGACLTLASAATQERDKCCYTHPNFSGTCEVTLGDEETCQSVLQYLNTPNSLGKNVLRRDRAPWRLAAHELRRALGFAPHSKE